MYTSSTVGLLLAGIRVTSSGVQMRAVCVCLVSATSFVGGKAIDAPPQNFK